MHEPIHPVRLEAFRAMARLPQRFVGKSFHMANLNPLKFCFHGRHSKPRAGFRTLPGLKNPRQVCAECFDRIIAGRKIEANIAVPRRRPRSG